MDYALRLGNAALPQAGFCLIWTVSTVKTDFGYFL